MFVVLCLYYFLRTVHYALYCFEKYFICKLNTVRYAKVIELGLDSHSLTHRYSSFHLCERTGTSLMSHKVHLDQRAIVPAFLYLSCSFLHPRGK